MKVILSIKYEYAKKILNGEKIVELRKRKFKEKVSLIYLYAISPVKKIVGYIEIEKIVKKDKNILWDEVKDKACISKKDFNNYYQNQKNGVAIYINKFKKYEKYKNYNEIDKNGKPPQSFKYLT